MLGPGFKTVASAIAMMQLLLIATAAEALPVTLTASGPDTGIEISFSMPAPFTNGQDAIQFGPSSSSSGGPLLTTTSLFDGVTLLGTGPSLIGGPARFADAGSLFAASAIIVDFTTIADQSIDGLVRIVVTQGFWSFDTDDLTAQAFGCCGSLPAENPVITGFALVPEPSTALLVGIGLAGLASYRRRLDGRELVVE